MLHDTNRSGKVALRGMAESVGLCASCKHMRRIESDRGSVFYLCELSKVDPTFPKYPRLTVLSCAGYDKQTIILDPDCQRG